MVAEAKPKVGTYHNGVGHLCQHKGLVIRAFDGVRYRAIGKSWSSLGEVGDTFPLSKGEYIIESVPWDEEPKPEYTFNKVQRQILKWVRELDSTINTGTMMGQLTQYRVFHKSQTDADIREGFRNAFYSMFVTWSEKDKAKAQKIINGGKKPAREGGLHKIGDVLNRDQLKELPAGSIVDLVSRPDSTDVRRLVREDGRLQRLTGSWTFSQYNDSYRFVVKYIHQ